MLQYFIQIAKSLFPFIQSCLSKPKNGSELMENSKPPQEREHSEQWTSDKEIPILKDFLKLNQYSRPGIKRKEVKGIEVHWIAAPKRTPKDVRNWWTPQEGTKGRYASTQFIIDLDGSIVQFIPEDEIAYSSGAKVKDYKDGIVAKFGTHPYLYTLSVECCHLDWNGTMTDQTYSSLSELVVHLCRKYGLSGKDLYLHWDFTGKICHKFFVDNPKKWGEFKDNVDSILEGSKA